MELSWGEVPTGLSEPVPKPPGWDTTGPGDHSAAEPPSRLVTTVEPEATLLQVQGEVTGISNYTDDGSP